MTYILSREEMSLLDRHTIEKYGMPGRLLMELAGKGCFDFLKKTIPEGGKVALFCGTGNNGGDGFVIARWLKNYGYHPLVFVVGDVSRMSPETEANYSLLFKCKVPVISVTSSGDWEKYKNLLIPFHPEAEHRDDKGMPEQGCSGYIESSSGRACYTEAEHGGDSGRAKTSSVLSFPEEEYPLYSGFDVIIDALFGIGFRGKFKSPVKEIVNDINRLSCLKAAIDIPSGLDAANGLADVAFYADYTLTMAAPKYGHYLGQGKEISGNVVVIDIGIPLAAWLEKSPVVTIAGKDNVVLPLRKYAAHKGHYGRAAVIAGSPGYTGAALLACKAALKSGAGLITLYHRKGLEEIFESGLIEVMTHVIGGGEHEKNVSTANIDEKELFDELNKNDVLLIGPGLRLLPQTVSLVELVLTKWDKPAVFDADAINTLAAERDLLALLKKKGFLITPHVGEFARLMQVEIMDVVANPVSFAQKFIEEYQCPLLLKSSYRLFADKERTVLDISGNDGLATGGSGDVLAGIIVSLLAQKSSVSDAAVAGSYLLGKTAEYCGLQYETRAITPTMIIENLFKIGMRC